MPPSRWVHSTRGETRQEGRRGGRESVSALNAVADSAMTVVQRPTWGRPSDTRSDSRLSTPGRGTGFHGRWPHWTKPEAEPKGKGSQPGRWSPLMCASSVAMTMS